MLKCIETEICHAKPSSQAATNIFSNVPLLPSHRGRKRTRTDIQRIDPNRTEVKMDDMGSVWAYRNSEFWKVMLYT
jgi:hypothetical protein